MTDYRRPERLVGQCGSFAVIGVDGWGRVGWGTATTRWRVGRDVHRLLLSAMKVFQECVGGGRTLSRRYQHAATHAGD